MIHDFMNTFILHLFTLFIYFAMDERIPAYGSAYLRGFTYSLISRL